MPLTLTPAYCRDYTSKAAVLADFNADRDFVVQPEGVYVNKAQLLEMGTRTVNIRYKNLRNIAVVDVK